jgi:hypothetical protein
LPKRITGPVKLAKLDSIDSYSYMKKYFASDLKMKLDTGGMAEIKACRGLTQVIHR